MFQRSFYLIYYFFELFHLPTNIIFRVDIVKHTSVKFSATSVAKGSVVLSKAVEKNFALESEISRLRHHVSVLLKRLHLVTLERNNLQLALEDLSSCPPVQDTGLPSGDVVVEEMGLPDATEEVAVTVPCTYVVQQATTLYFN